MTDLARRPGPTTRTRVEVHAGDTVSRREDRLATEEPLEIRLAWPGVPAHRAWVTMRTPGHDFELAAGWAAHEGLLPGGSLGAGHVASVAYCTDTALAPDQEFNVVTLTLREPPVRDPGTRHDTSATGSSACGVCGKDSIDAALDVPPGASRWAGEVPQPDVVRRLPDALRGHQKVFSRTGGAHAAALCEPDGTLLVVREDVGRHNAVDKVAGARVLAGKSVSVSCLLVSGRAGFELVHKAVSAGVGSLVAVGAPTSLSVQLARDSGLVLYGFAHGDRCVRYA
ncbi:formate dehydrogenase accessory sulfurtransferase FdhD [Nocardioides sp. LHG3406-4]|uniref:formate dehydrogenase accessory sulfurtransferase FdhD n=1 Tax=Nocardioides sp. LHG3406-4 TaxID=2804575 RepID=UPI003CF1CB76